MIESLTGIQTVKASMLKQPFDGVGSNATLGLYRLIFVLLSLVQLQVQ